MTVKSIQIGKIDDGEPVSPIAMLVQIASKHDSSVYLETDGRKINAKSIMGLMSLKITEGLNVDIIADGEDETTAIEDLERFLTAE